MSKDDSETTGASQKAGSVQPGECSADPAGEMIMPRTWGTTHAQYSHYISLPLTAYNWKLRQLSGWFNRKRQGK